MQFWIKCTRHGNGDPYHVNISLVGGMRREGNKTILEFVGSNAQTIEVSVIAQRGHGRRSTAAGASAFSCLSAISAIAHFSRRMILPENRRPLFGIMR